MFRSLVLGLFVFTTVKAVLSSPGLYGASAPMAENWWKQVGGTSLAQGDLLPKCRTPYFPEEPDEDTVLEVEGLEARLIVVTQSCDLENAKVDFVAFCTIHTLDEFAEISEPYRKRSKWNDVVKGRIPGLHLLVSPENPGDNSACLVVDFGHILSLPIEYVRKHADSLGNRWRLASPYLEHFSQAFARFFMRVGLPSGIEPFK